MAAKASTAAKYDQIIEHVFFLHHNENVTAFYFNREELTQAARELELSAPKNLGDILNHFRFRADMPQRIRDTISSDKFWIIRLAGRSRYQFSVSPLSFLIPTSGLSVTKVPDSTPGIVAKYRLSDEQALLAELRYNRLIDIYSGVTCYSLQNHLRTTVSDLGQVETDEIYIGVDRRGAHYAFPVQAKGGSDRLSIVQIEQDFKLCAEKFPALICRPIAAQFMADDLIALFEFEIDETGVALSSEKHYRLVPPDAVTAAELESYRARP
ncbi:MAG: endonuclease [Thermomicrobiales bacterium]